MILDGFSIFGGPKLPKEEHSGVPTGDILGGLW